jgi:hypothetical protein
MHRLDFFDRNGDTDSKKFLRHILCRLNSLRSDAGLQFQPPIAEAPSAYQPPIEKQAVWLP